MTPFDTAFADLSAALGKINPELVNKLESVTNVQSSAGTVHELNKKNSFGRFAAVGYRGTVDASYDRINLTALLGVTNKQDRIVRSRSKPATSHQALKLVNRKWGLGLSPDQVKLVPVQYGSDDVGLVTIEMADGDLAAFGRFQFYVIPGADNISDLPLQYELGDALYPSGQTAKGQAQLLSFPVDTTAHNGYISSLFVGKPIDEELRLNISEMTGIEWSLNPGQYSLSGASISYVGECRPGWDLVKPNFTHNVVIRLGTACTNFAGDLTFYFNPN